MATVLLTNVIPSRFVHLTPPNAENIERIRADLKDGSKLMLNMPHAFRVGDKWELLAGHDRTEAARLAGWDRIELRDFSGVLNSDDAILAHFCRENLLRKEVSKAAIAGEWLRKHPEWMDVRIAAASGCSADYVGEVRAELLAAGEIISPAFRESEDGTKRKSYKPRTVRTDVPSKRGIPAPPGRAERDTGGRATTVVAPVQEAPEVSGISTVEATPDGGAIGTTEVGEPTGAPALPNELPIRAGSYEEVPTERNEAPGSELQPAEQGSTRTSVPAPTRGTEDGPSAPPDLNHAVVEVGAAVFVGPEDARVLSMVEGLVGGPVKIADALTLRALLARRPDDHLTTLKANIRTLQSVALQWEIAIGERTTASEAA